MEVLQPQLGTKDTTKLAALVVSSKEILRAFEEMATRLGIKDSLPAWRTELLQKRSRASEMKQIESLITNETLKQLLTARMLTQVMKRNLLPLSQEDLELLTEKVTIQPIRDYMMAANNHYLELGNKKLSYMSSLKNTNHLREAKDAEALFKELILPYRGKVIYMDFWGTWCGPCRKQMRYVGEVKKELEKRT